MKVDIVENYLKGLEKLPGSVEGLTKLVNGLTAGLRLSPLSDDEMERLATRFCKNANKARRRTKKGAGEQ